MKDRESFVTGIISQAMLLAERLQVDPTFSRVQRKWFRANCEEFLKKSGREVGTDEAGTNPESGVMKLLAPRFLKAASAFESTSESLVEANLRLVIKIAREYLWSRIPLEDLLQEGNLGLMRAAESFDPRKKVKFTTYAIPWVRKSIRLSLGELARDIRLPIWFGEAISSIHRKRIEFERDNHRQPRTEELAAAIGLRVKRVVQITTLDRGQVSLETPVAGLEDVVLGDLIPVDVPAPEDLAVESLTREAIDAGIKKLPERHQAILRWLFDTDGCGIEFSPVDLAAQWDVSTVAVHKLKKDALERLRKIVFSGARPQES